MNQYGKARQPFLFIIDFEMKKIIVERLDELSDEIVYQIGDYGNNSLSKTSSRPHFESLAIQKDEYQLKFASAQEELAYGNSFLLNLTCATPLLTQNNLSDFYAHAQAQYKVLLKNEFVSFSPESFVKIKNGRIYSYPMKGTSSFADDPDGSALLNNQKENAEHATIVDLIRNDLSIVSKDVRVERFKYLDLLHTDRGDLYQMSSEVSGILEDQFHNWIGSLLFKLLPAGSISGAPKAKTVEIIRSIEAEERGYYTGIAGVFDGYDLDSTVLIRYIEKKKNQFFYRSGGGITFMSDFEGEYQELIKKVYVPISGEHKDTEWPGVQHPQPQQAV